MPYFGVMPKGSRENTMPYKLFDKKEEAERWLMHNQKSGWKIVEFRQKVMDYITMKSKEKSRIGKLF